MIYNINGNTLMQAPSNQSVRDSVIGAVSRRISLRSADLKGIPLKGQELRGIDIRHSDISGGDFSECYITQGKFQSVNGKGCNFSDCFLFQCDFSKAYLRDATFTNCVIYDCNFTQSKLHHVRAQNCHIETTLFSGACLDNADFSVTSQSFSLNRFLTRHPNLRTQSHNFAGHLNYSPSINRCNLSEAHLYGTNFQNMKFDSVNFCDTFFSGSNFSDCYINNANFLNGALDCVKFDRTTIHQSELSGSENCNSSFVNCKFSHMLIAKAEFDKCDFAAATFLNVRFAPQNSPTPPNGSDGESENDNDKIHFKNCKMNQCRFQDSTLCRVNFTSNDMREATFLGGTLQNTIFSLCIGKSIVFNSVHNFTRTQFNGCALFGSNFTSSIISGLQFQSCDLQHSRFPINAKNEMRISQCNEQFSSLNDDLSYEAQIALLPPLPPHMPNPQISGPTQQPEPAPSQPHATAYTGPIDTGLNMDLDADADADAEDD